MKIHKEGFRMIPLMSVLIAGLYVLLYWLILSFIVQVILALAGVLFFVLVVRFFRDPKVITPEKDGVVYAPAEGKVVVIEKTYEGEYHKEDRIQVSIFMSPFNVHVNRSPVKGVVDFFKYHPGKFLVAWHPKSSTNNERTSVGFKTENGVKILMRQIAGAVARRIAFYPKVGDEVNQGTSVGFIRFGSRVDLFLPLDADIKVKIGDLTRGGETEVAALN
ncbi:MAG: phosphatidylserine decarboxylase family protein [Ekhidna sp.]|nr:phosphatidylserine decarboxylase family protein [Ekhidna sp.]MBC6425121.1 phosphatidylserine decarboxylase family protein [Ekhidna sp.]